MDFNGLLAPNGLLRRACEEAWKPLLMERGDFEAAREREAELGRLLPADLGLDVAEIGLPRCPLANEESSSSEDDGTISNPDKI